MKENAASADASASARTRKLQQKDDLRQCCFDDEVGAAEADKRQVVKAEAAGYV